MVKYSAKLSAAMAVDAVRSKLTEIHAWRKGSSGPQNRCSGPNASRQQMYSPPDLGISVPSSANAREPSVLSSHSSISTTHVTCHLCQLLSSHQTDNNNNDNNNTHTHYKSNNNNNNNRNNNDDDRGETELERFMQRMLKRIPKVDTESGCWISMLVDGGQKSG